MWGITEAITIRWEKENKNRDEGRYTLSHLYENSSTQEIETRLPTLSEGGGTSPLFATTVPPDGNTSPKGFPDVGFKN